jgi:F0F1-type ATP synthase membrane subunit b/b'
MAESQFGGVLVQDKGTSPSSQFGGVSVDDVPKVAKKEPVTDQVKKSSLYEKGMDVLGSSAKGAIVGAALPEIFTGAGMVAPMIPGGQVVSPFLLAGGQLLRGQRLGSAITGAVSGGGATALGQAVPGGEKVVADIPGAQITRKDVAETVGGFLGPGAFTTAAGIVKGAPVIKDLWRAAAKFAGGESDLVEAATRELANFRNKIPVNQLLNAERFRVSKTDTDAYRQVFDVLKTADQKTQNAITADLSTAQEKANAILADGKRRAEAVLGTSKDKAQQIINDADVKAKAVIDQSVADAQKKLGIAQRAKAAGEKATAAPQQTLTAIGNPNVPLSTAGGNLQQRVSQVVSEEQAALNEAYNTAKTGVTTLVQGKEKQGIGVSTTKAFGELQSFLNRKLGLGKEGEALKFAEVSEPTLKNSYKTISNAINEQKIFEGINEAGQPIYRQLPSSFEALDHVRRRLGEVFSGKEVEGFKGLQKQQAMDLYKKIREIQVEYAGGKGGPFDNLLKTYSEGKDVLDALRIPAGKKIIKKDLINPEYFTYDPSGLPGEFFKTRKKVEDLVKLTGDAAFVEKQASDYVARTLKDSNAKAAEKYLYDNKEWLDLFPVLKGRVEGHVNALRRAESVGPKTAELAKGLKTEIKGLPGAAEKEAGRIKTEAEKAAEAEIKAGKKSAAETVKLAEKEAKELTGGAKLKSLGLTGDPVKEMENLITRGETVKLQQVAPIINSDPAIRKSFEDALDITLSRSDPKAIGDAWERTIKPALENTGLISPEKSAEVTKRLQVVQMTLEPSAIAQTARFIIKNALTTAAGVVGND